MKKLYMNIENINIKGGPEQLTDVVKSMDRSLQNIAANTDQMTGYLMRYSVSNKGAQFVKAVNSTLKLRDDLFDMSLELNEMQKQVVEYQNKVFRFEGKEEMAQAPNPYLVTKKQVNAETTDTQISRTEMVELAAIIRNYIENVYHHSKSIIDKKNEIAAVWRDSQYNDFAEFIDDVIRNIGKSVRELEEYVQTLEERIKELS